MKNEDYINQISKFVKTVDDFFHSIVTDMVEIPSKPIDAKLVKKDDFAGFVKMFTTDENRMMDWYQKVFGFEFVKLPYNLNTARQLYYYAAYNKRNMPWIINNVKGVVLHPAYNKSDCIINGTASFLGFEWVNYNGVRREPIYKFEYSVSNLQSLLNNLKKLGIHSEIKNYDYTEQLIYKYHKTKHIITDPRNNVISLWDRDSSYKQNLITQEKTQIDSFFIVNL